MVIKGNARGGAGSLAAHLQRTDTNEVAELRELRGVAAEDLDGALREMEAVAAGGRSGRHFYHASINTRVDEVLTPKQWLQAVDRLERELDLVGQPRAVVAHVKEGRAHVHIAWSRIDLETLKAIPDSHNYRRHEIVARELEREFGHERVQGAHIERAGEERPARTPSHAEMQQAERTGLTAEDAKGQLTEIWNRTDSGKAFAAAIADAGWTLARGDKRDFVVIDTGGEAHSLARRIEGAKAKDIRARMEDVDPAALPSVDEARSYLLSKRQTAEVSPNRLAELASAPTLEAAGELDQKDKDAGAQADRSSSIVSTSEGGMVAQQRLANKLMALHWALRDEPDQGADPPRNPAAVRVDTAAERRTNDPPTPSSRASDDVESRSSRAGLQVDRIHQPADSVENKDAILTAWPMSQNTGETAGKGDRSAQTPTYSSTPLDAELATWATANQSSDEVSVQNKHDLECDSDGPPSKDNQKEPDVSAPGL